jgi:transcriptional regulator with XRE-family HTH domain
MEILDDISSSPERMKDFQRERLALEITELICQIMEAEGVSRAELATRLGKSRAYVTKLLGGNTNMTIKTLSDVFHALGRSLRVVDRPLSVWSPRLLVAENPATPTSNKEARDGDPPAGHGRLGVGLLAD